MNFVFISCNFPKIYSHFVKSLALKGVTVLGIGDTPYSDIEGELKQYLTEYCYVSDLSHLDWLKNTLDYLEWKYGHISFIESNNEYWLMSDSYLREYKKIENGFYPLEMDKIKYKSKMKQYFKEAGVKVARYKLCNNLDETKEFIQLVNYPIFVKPDNGVGASKSYKINDDNELIAFFKNKDDEQYIFEEFIDGTIVSFDGIVDDDSNPLIYFKETFEIPVADVVNNDLDDYYYASVNMDENFKDIGKRVLKSFGVRKRCFHIEFFRLNKDKEGLAKKGEYLGLEVNMRPPGGDTPDLLSIALNNSFYDCYANIIVNNKIDESINPPFYIAISVSKKNRFKYIHSDEEIYSLYKENIARHGYYNKEIADAMGDEFYLAKFNNVEDALAFKNYIQAK